MINYAYYKFEFGYLTVGYEDSAIVSLDAAAAVTGNNVRSKLSDEAYRQIREYLDGQRYSFDLPLRPKGTEFQQKVWKALLDIPYGETRTYGEIAAAIGNPKACRAVGMANHFNPIFIVIPCHRVIGVNGSLTGYAGGLDMKAALLELEQKNHMKVEKKDE